jgi:hypothetical protein
MRRALRTVAAAAMLLAICGCGDGASPEREATPVKVQPAAPAAAPPPVTTTSSNPLLAKAAVQEAIHRALTTGQNQRWEDGGLSGYAVPGETVQANGCRTVRYTVDQRPDEPMMTVNACDASR